MNIFLKIALTFFKIGLLTVGGGLAMIPVIQQEITRLGWLDNQQFLDILGIAQMTPGPFSVNLATFVGYRVIGTEFPGVFWLGVAGAAAGTIAVCLPSLICINLLGAFWVRNRAHPCMVRVFDILRPLVTGLVVTAAMGLAVHCMLGHTSHTIFRHASNFTAIAVIAVAFALTAFTKLSPVLVLAGGLCVGMMFGMANG